MRPFLPLAVLVALLTLAPAASAGSRDAPELTDAADDCAFALGNEYADIISAWISDETALDFHVNIELAKFTNDALAAYTGYTLQFTHQGVQWGVVALHEMGSWSFSTAFLDTQTGQMDGSADTHGEWDASTRTMTILFPKGLFPHDGDDNKLSGFTGGSADLKKDIPIYIAQGMGAPIPDPAFLGCDAIESSATYTFTVGQHTMHQASTNETSATTEMPATPAPDAIATPAPAGSAPAATRDTPAPPLALLLTALACLAAVRRRF